MYGTLYLSWVLATSNYKIAVNVRRRIQIVSPETGLVITTIFMDYKHNRFPTLGDRLYSLGLNNNDSIRRQIIPLHYHHGYGQWQPPSVMAVYMWVVVIVLYIIYHLVVSTTDLSRLKGYKLNLSVVIIRSNLIKLITKTKRTVKVFREIWCEILKMVQLTYKGIFLVSKILMKSRNHIIDEKYGEIVIQRRKIRKHFTWGNRYVHP